MSIKFKPLLKATKKFVTRTIPTFTAKHLPEILVFSGIGMVGSGFVIGCINSTKLKEVSIDVSKKIEHDKAKLAENSEPKGSKLIPIYLKRGGAYIKLYWLPVTLELAGVAAITGSYLVQKKRGKELMAAYTALAISSMNYRQAVIDRYGKEVDEELAYGVKTEINEVQKGKKTITTTKQIVKEPEDYRIVYKKGSPGWSDDYLLRETFLYGVERHANDILNIKGKLLLNDVYDMLGYPRTKYGALFGWVKNEDDETRNTKVAFSIIDVAKKQWYIDHQNEDDVYSETEAPPVYFVDFNVACNVLKYM